MRTQSGKGGTLLKEAYINILELEEFATAREQLNRLLSNIVSPEMAHAQHGEVEERLRADGTEFLRGILQGTLDLRSKDEVKHESVTGADGIERTHRREGAKRDLMSVFGEVEVKRIAYSQRGVERLCPLDAELNLPPDKFSHGIRRRNAEEVTNVSFEQSLTNIGRTTGGKLHKLQAEQITVKLAQDFDSFYELRQADSPEKTADPLVLTLDGKGIKMRKDSLREPTKKAAERGQHKLKTRLCKGEKRNSKRMATVASVYSVAPHERSPESVMGLEEKAKVQVPPRARNKRVFASVKKDAMVVCEEAFQEALKRDPEKKRPWVIPVDGAEHQLANVEACIETHEVKDVTIILDFVHVTEYVWQAAFCFNPEGSQAAESWVGERLLKILQGKATDVAAGMRRSATKRNLSKPDRKAVDKCADYLLKYSHMLRYDDYLRHGFPIGTGVIEGACRHLVKDRMDITGARWGLESAEAILKIRSLQSSEDFDAYWEHHKVQELHRNHLTRYAPTLPQKAA